MTMVCRRPGTPLEAKPWCLRLTDELRRDLEARIENLSLRLTVRMGVMLAAGLTLLGAVLKLH
jgi:hypothetical protein